MLQIDQVDTAVVSTTGLDYRSVFVTRKRVCLLWLRISAWRGLTHACRFQNQGCINTALLS
jgi:hypothetical protein